MHKYTSELRADELGNSAAKIVSWMNKKFMDDIPSKLHQLFYIEKSCKPL
jgi:hypothetical protein